MRAYDSAPSGLIGATPVRFGMKTERVHRVQRSALRPSGAPEGRPDNSDMGKAFEAAVLGKMPAGPASFFPSGLARLRRAEPEGKKDRSFGPQPRAALRLAWAIIYIVPSGLQFGSLRAHRTRTLRPATACAFANRAEQHKGRKNIAPNASSEFTGIGPALETSGPNDSDG
jgi:hypothetical protein